MEYKYMSNEELQDKGLLFYDRGSFGYTLNGYNVNVQANISNRRPIDTLDFFYSMIMNMVSSAEPSTLQAPNYFKVNELRINGATDEEIYEYLDDVNNYVTYIYHDTIVSRVTDTEISLVNIFISGNIVLCFREIFDGDINKYINEHAKEEMRKILSEVKPLKVYIEELTKYRKID